MARKNSDDDSLSDDNAFSDDDDDDEDEEEKMKFFPITCRGSTDGPTNNTVFDSLLDAIQYDLKTQHFDLLSFLPASSDEDFFEKSIIVVNKCREFVLKSQHDDAIVGEKLTEYLMQQGTSDSEDDDEHFFKPVLEDDAILMSMDDLEALQKEKEQEQGSVASDSKDVEESKNNSDSPSNSELALRIATLEQQLASAKACISSLTKEEDVKTATASSTRKASTPKKQDNDTYYFSGYSHHSIHETMLKDFVRTSSYEKAILSNTETLFKDKVVLDIGCGTGVLSLFAAKAGARKVIAIDNSDIIDEASTIVQLNGYGDIITCVRGKVEDLLAQGGGSKSQLPLEDGEKVDVIVSEWMGYALLFETMLPSVMVARDTIMNKETGTMFPNGSNVLLEGATDDRLSYWDNVHEINMTPMKHRVVRELTTEATVEIVDPTKIVTNRIELIYFDLNTCKDQDLDFEVSFQLEPKIAEEEESVNINKLVVSFDIDFNLSGTNAVSFSTGCQSQATHWQQTTLWFDPTNGVPSLQKGDVLRGEFKMGRNEVNHREMDFLVIWEVGHNVSDNNDEFVRKLDGVIKSKLTV